MRTNFASRSLVQKYLYNNTMKPDIIHSNTVRAPQQKYAKLAGKGSTKSPTKDLSDRIPSHHLLISSRLIHRLYLRWSQIRR
uniref:Uncharacterized protein n=1 Tax=Arundo donax TaxID=35708 RepID=A0A0A9GFA2_ARUDO